MGKQDRNKMGPGSRTRRAQPIPTGKNGACKEHGKVVFYGNTTEASQAHPDGDYCTSTGGKVHVLWTPS